MGLDFVRLPSNGEMQRRSVADGSSQSVEPEVLYGDLAGIACIGEHGYADLRAQHLKSVLVKRACDDDSQGMDENGPTISKVLMKTAFAHLPVFIAWSGMKQFGGRPVLGIALGLMPV